MGNNPKASLRKRIQRIKENLQRDFITKEMKDNLQRDLEKLEKELEEDGSIYNI